MSGPASQDGRSGIWIISTLTGEIRKLADDAGGAVFSPDGSRIAYTSRGGEGIELMGANGEAPRRFATAEAGGRFGSLGWSPDGLRLACHKNDSASGVSAVEIRNLVGGQRAVVVRRPRYISFTWTRDDRLVFLTDEAPPNEGGTSLWEARIDPTSPRDAQQAWCIPRGASGGRRRWHGRPRVGAPVRSNRGPRGCQVRPS